MFYSDLILTKKGALAKVWMAAHMESKLTKVQFNSVDVVQSVSEYEGPFALLEDEWDASTWWMGSRRGRRGSGRGREEGREGRGEARVPSTRHLDLQFCRELMLAALGFTSSYSAMT